MAEWQTRGTQNAVSFGTCGFDSHLRHRVSVAAAGSIGTVAVDRSPSEQIDARIEELGDWRGETLGRVRAVIKEADPGVIEEWKWVKPTNPGTPVWSHDGIICTGETYKETVKMTFARGAALEDPSGLFNASLGGNTRRAIDLHEGEQIDADALKDLVREAVALNESRARS